MVVKYLKGDLFQLTKTVSKKPLLLAHACNCLGIWGGGIANQFKINYFSSYELYHTYCHLTESPSDLLGTSLLLPVSATDGGFVKGMTDNLVIVCLFTSVIGQESETEIAHNTKLAMLDLTEKLKNPNLIENEKVRSIISNYNKQISGPDGRIEVSKYTVNMPKINSGIFGVPWNLTEKSLLESELSCHVYEL